MAAYIADAWTQWKEHGPSLGLTVEFDSEWFPDRTEPGLKITGIGRNDCDGFFSVTELQQHGFSPIRIALPEQLAQIKASRTSRATTI